MESKPYIPLSKTETVKSDKRPEWIRDLPDEGWKVLPDRKVEGYDIYSVLAYNANLGENGVSMSIVEKPEIVEEKLRTLTTWEIQFDDFNNATEQDSLMVATIDLDQALGIPRNELFKLFISKDFWEEFGQRYSEKFLSLTQDDIDVNSLFNSEDGVQKMVDVVFSDLIEEIGRRNQENK